MLHARFFDAAASPACAPGDLLIRVLAEQRQFFRFPNVLLPTAPEFDAFNEPPARHPGHGPAESPRDLFIRMLAQERVFFRSPPQARPWEINPQLQPFDSDASRLSSHLFGYH